MTVTLKTIAKELGMSSMAVSYALRGSDEVSGETRDRVALVAKRLGYRPNASARAIRTGHFDSIAVLVDPDARSGALTTGMLLGLQETLAEAGSHLALDCIEDARLKDPSYIPPILRDRRVDGLVMNYHSRQPAGLARILAHAGMPVVWLNLARGTNAVCWNDRGAASALTRHLISLGHRRIAYADLGFNYPAGAPRHYSRDDRAAGYLEAMATAGLESATVFNAPDGGDRGVDHRVARDTLRSLHAGGCMPTACIAHDPGCADAIGVMVRELFAMRPPADLVLASFTSTAVADFHTPERTLWLTAMVHDDRELGRAAGRMLLAKLATTFESMRTQRLDMVLSAGQTAHPPT